MAKLQRQIYFRFYYDAVQCAFFCFLSINDFSTGNLALMIDINLSREISGKRFVQLRETGKKRTQRNFLMISIRHFRFNLVQNKRGIFIDNLCRYILNSVRNWIHSVGILSCLRPFESVGFFFFFWCYNVNKNRFDLGKMPNNKTRQSSTISCTQQ